MILLALIFVTLLIIYFFGVEFFIARSLYAIAKITWFLVWVGFFSALGACVGAVIVKLFDIDLIFIGFAIGFVYGVYSNPSIEKFYED
jgi:hypothetical protein